jgi:alkylhydroperoxidase family enzyme
MPRIEPIRYEDAPAETRAAHDEHQRDHGRITNMKRTLLHSVPAFHALMEWYPLRDTVRPFLGDRLTQLFSHAISAETDCLICSTFFRRLLIEAGEDPDRLILDERERIVVAFGRQLATDAHQVSDALYADLARFFAPDQIVALTTFGAIMLATNVFNNALRVDLDGYLEPFRRREAAAPATPA